MEQALGSHAPQVAEFYRRHDGFVLYGDLLSEAAGIVLFPVEQWVEMTDEMRRGFYFLQEEPETDPDHIFTGIAIATVPYSGNYFVMPIDGSTAGQIFYADHDGWYDAAFADDFDGFLVRITQEPVHLLAKELGCYTRYSDGQTDAQWIPEEYFPDVTGIEA